MLKTIVGRLGVEGNTDKLREQLTAAGVDHVTATLEETVALVESMVQSQLAAQQETGPETRHAPLTLPS